MTATLDESQRVYMLRILECERVLQQHLIDFGYEHVVITQHSTVYKVGEVPFDYDEPEVEAEQ